MVAAPRISAAQRRARLAVRHHLAPGARASTPVEVARDLVALHGTDPASVFLAIAARTVGSLSAAHIEHAMYADRALARMLGMRRTVFTVTADLVPVVQAACTDDIARSLRRRYLQLLAQGGVPGDVDAWLTEVAESTAIAIASRGGATAAQLAQDEPRLRTRVMLAPDKSYGGAQGVATWVLTLLAADGRIIRGQPRGSWTSSQYRWLPIEAWLPGGLSRPPAPAARVELLRRWLTAYGPATTDDVRWWTGWTVGRVRAAAAQLDLAVVDLDGTEGIVLADDLPPVPEPAPWAALLPALDPTVMGWRARQWYLGEHGPALTDRSGNLGPTVWWHGEVVGAWAQRASGEIAVRLLRDPGATAAAAVAEEAERLRCWLGDSRVTPRFRTPLERELSA